MTQNSAKALHKSRRNEDLVPHIVDYLAGSQPNGLFAQYPISSTKYEEGYRDISYSALANAVNGLAHWIKRELGAPKSKHEVIAYIGPNDIRYLALVLAAVKVGYIMLFTSTRNSVSAHITLFEKLNCNTILGPNPRPPQVQAITESYVMRLADIPSVETLLTNQFEHFPYDKKFPDDLSEPLLIVHTSGSTGFPKPLVYRHGTAITNTKLMTLDPPEGFRSVQRMFEGKKLFMTFPPFHGAYVVSSFFNCLPLGTVFLSPISGAIPSAEGLVEGLKKAPADIAFIVPSIVLELAQRPDLLEYCANNLEFIMYCGGDLPQSIGDVVASKIKLVNQYGASEIGICALLHREDHVLRDWKFRGSTANFHNFPGTTEYATRDLFVKHPTKPDMWSWKARADDIIVFLNGEKTNPISMEQHIVARNPKVTATLVIGAQRFQAALLLEIGMGRERSLEERAHMIEKIWPSIQEANRECPAHAKVAKSHILFIVPSKPLLRTGKGTIQRVGSLTQYENEINTLYAKADRIFDLAERSRKISIDSEDESAVSDYIRDTIDVTTSWECFKNTDSFFQLGMDSLQGLMVVRKLRLAFELPTIALSTLYSNPSVNDLTAALIRMSKNDILSKESDLKTHLDQRAVSLHHFQRLVDKISHSMPIMTSTNALTKHTVILTGSTGMLGSYLLANLLTDPLVGHVYCLNRRSNSAEIQQERNVSLNLPEISHERTKFLTADLTAPSFGLPAETYKKLLVETSLIIHCAWPVNFNLSLSEFQPPLLGLVSILDFVTSSSLRPHVHYISSISSVMSPDFSVVPEQIIPSISLPLPNAYAESKHISELLLAYAAKKFQLTNSISRVGQISGAADTAGLWNPSEWFPSLVISSAHLGALPDSLGAMDRIDWVPIDKLASIIADISLKTASEAYLGTQVFHPVHPNATTWSDLRPIVLKSLEDIGKKDIQIVSTQEWIDSVKKDMESGVGGVSMREEELHEKLQNNPAAKLIDFYESAMGNVQVHGDTIGVVLDVQKTQGKSAKLRGLEASWDTWIEKWIAEWMVNYE